MFKIGIKITGIDKLKKKLSNPEELLTDLVNDNGGVEIECPNCQKVIKVPTAGTTCSCGQKINLEF